VLAAYGSVTGLRDRALVGVLVYTFAHVSAVLQVNVGNYFSPGRRGWVRLYEKWQIAREPLDSCLSA